MCRGESNKLLLDEKIESLKWTQDFGILFVLVPFLLLIGSANLYFILLKLLADPIGIVSEYIKFHSTYRIVVPLVFSIWFIVFSLLCIFDIFFRRIKLWQYKKEFLKNPETWFCGTELNHKLILVPPNFFQTVLIPLGYVTVAMMFFVSLSISYDKSILYLLLTFLLAFIVLCKLRYVYLSYRHSSPLVEIDRHPLPQNTNSKLLVYFAAIGIDGIESITLVCEETRTNTRSKHTKVEFRDICRERLFDSENNKNGDNHNRVLINFSVPSNKPNTQKKYNARISEEMTIKWKIEIDYILHQGIQRKAEYDLYVCPCPRVLKRSEDD